MTRFESSARRRRSPFAQGELATLQKQADANPGNLEDQVELASGFDRAGNSTGCQGDFANAFKNFDQELGECQQLAQHKTGDPDCLQRAAQSFEQLGNQEFNKAATLDQAGDGTGRYTRMPRRRSRPTKRTWRFAMQLLHAAPEDVDAQHNAALASNHAGIVLYWIGRNTEGDRCDSNGGAACSRKSPRRIAASPQVRVDLLWILYNLSQRSNVGTEAKDSLSKSLAIATELAHQHGGPTICPVWSSFCKTPSHGEEAPRELQFTLQGSTLVPEVATPYWFAPEMV